MKIDLKKYLKLYSLEDYLFDILGPQIKNRGYIKFDEFYRICMWKSSRQKPNYIKNKKIVEKITKKAFLEKNEKGKINILCSMKGVGIPTASAILTIVFPNKYAIIDIRCMEMLIQLKLLKSKNISINTWIDYLNVVRLLAKENNTTSRNIDKALFAMHKESLDNNNFQNLYN
jgi:thermostable 8-oxoguanine DNA glycosylase